jgi:hemerythrin superfamily protein
MMDSTINGGNQAFPVDRPVEALLRDHRLVRTLIESYWSSGSEAVKINAAEQILMLLETHALLEEGTFYPAVREVAPELIALFEQQHAQTDELLVRLKETGLADTEAFLRFEQLIEMMLMHIEEEETQFFPQLEAANLDMTAIGLQMQAQEANLVHVQAQANQQGSRV